MLGAYWRMEGYRRSLYRGQVLCILDMRLQGSNYRLRVWQGWWKQEEYSLNIVGDPVTASEQVGWEMLASDEAPQMW